LRYPSKDEQPVTFRRNSRWQVGRGRSLELGATGHLMAIVNVTPDSFSDGGRHASVGSAVVQSLMCVRDGAAIIDIGGESTRPGAAEVTAAEEQDRVLPVIEKLAGETDALISIDTYRAETARLAIAAGAHIINDVHGLQREPEIAAVAAETGAGVCIMHTGRGREKRVDHIEDQTAFLKQSLQIARAAGIADEAIVLDPGFGFAKDRDDDLVLMARFSELHDLGFPLLAGTSRKRFLGAVTEREKPDERDVATAATTAILRMAGAAIFRVHNVAPNRDALRIADAVLAAASVPARKSNSVFAKREP
jgi:dihydropteroate synthase